jgi:hypothetical protein
MILILHLIKNNNKTATIKTRSKAINNLYKDKASKTSFKSVTIMK